MKNLNRKKILFVTRPLSPPWDEASKNFAYSLAKNISQSEINIMTDQKDSSFSSDLIFPHKVYTASENSRFDFWQKVCAIFFQFKIRNKFDIHHYFFIPTILNSFLIKNFLKNPKTKTIQTIATLREDLWSDKDIRKILFANIIIVYSAFAKNKLNNLGFENVFQIYPGIDLQEYKQISFQETQKNLLTDFSNESKVSKNFTKMHSKENDFVINFTGEYTRLGAIDLIIDSFIDIAKKNPSIKLSLAVRIKNEKDALKKRLIKKKLKKNNLLNQVSFFDNGRYKMKNVYNLCDISLFPVNNMQGKFDIPLAVVEAMACQKPVIISDLPILAELTNGKNSVIVKKDNQKELTDAILDLYTHPEKKRLIGWEARKFVEEKFNIKKIAQEYEKIYATL